MWREARAAWLSLPTSCGAPTVASTMLRSLLSALPPPVVNTCSTAPRLFTRSMAVHKKTMLNVVDNSGAKLVECIDYYGRRPARIGDAIRVVVKSARSDGRVSRKDILGAVIVRQKRVEQRGDGTTVQFQENSCVLMKRDLSGPIGTRVIGPVARELRKANFMKVIMMATRVV